MLAATLDRRSTGSRAVKRLFLRISGPKCKRDYDTWLYRERHLIECCINKLKHFRRIFSRFDKLDRSYLGFVHFVCALLWLR